MSISKFILALAGIILVWMLLVPIFEFPDEQAHFETVSYVAIHNQIPVGAVLDMTSEVQKAEMMLGVFRNPLGQNRYTYHPEYRPEYTKTLVGKYETAIMDLNTSALRTEYVGEEAARYPIAYYRYLSYFTKLVDQADLFTRLFITRMGGLGLALTLGMIIYLLGKELFAKEILARTLVAVTLLQPMMSFVTAGINSDNLHNLLFATILYLTVRLIKWGFSFWSLMSLALITILDIYTKPQGFIALLLIGIAICFYILRSHRWRLFLPLIGLGLLVLVLGKNEWSKYVGYFSFGNPRGLSFLEYVRFSGNKLMAQNVVWYWGVFKWLGVVLPPLYWRVANRVVLLSGVGLIVYLFKVIKKQKKIADPYVILYLLVTSLLYAGAIFFFDWEYTKSVGFSLGIQARYFFPTLPAHMALLLTGILSFGGKERVVEWLRKGVVLLFVWLQLGGLWRLITSYYTVASWSSFVIEVSQYKPWFAKGDWWYLWIGLYFVCLLYLLKTLLMPRNDRT